MLIKYFWKYNQCQFVNLQTCEILHMFKLGKQKFECLSRTSFLWIVENDLRISKDSMVAYEIDSPSLDECTFSHIYTWTFLKNVAKIHLSKVSK